MPTMKIRKLTEHAVNPVNDKLEIFVGDNPGPGGANHRYDILGFSEIHNPSAFPWLMGGDQPLTILFQNGPINEVGVNGITHEALLVILIDRLRSFQAGPYACDENMCALVHLEEALSWLHQRTLDRMERNVEGTSKE